MKKLRANSYEAQLTPDELRELHAHLSQPGTSLLQTQLRAPAWRKGPLAGAKPCLATLSNIAARLRAENRLLDIEASEKLLRAVVQKLQSNPNCPTELIDQLCQLVGHDIVQSYLREDPPHDRITQFRLLLKRQEQRMAQDKTRHDLTDVLLQFNQLQNHKL